MTDYVDDRISVEAFIAHAEQHPDKRFDIINGEIVEVSPKPYHGQIQATLALLIGLWLRENPIGVAQTEVLHVLDGRKLIFRTGETIGGIPGFDGLTIDVDELFV